MLTASFFLHSGVGRISIARWAPKQALPGLKSYRALAPGAAWKAADWPSYQRLYAEQLAALDPEQTWEELHDLVAPHEPVLLCWERLSATEKCHRRLVAQWFERSLGVQVPELGQERCSA